MSKKSSGSSTASANRREQLRRQQEATARAARNRRIVGIGAGVIALVLLAVLVTVFVQNMNKGGADGAAIAPPRAVTNPYGVEIGSNKESGRDGIGIHQDKAKADAPVVEVFVDYQCPGCASFDNTYGAKLNELAGAGDIKLQVHTMTFLDRLGAGKSTNPAIAAACADTVDAYPAYHLGVFHHQPQEEGPGYTEDQLRVQIPAEAGITGDKLTQFQSCYDSKATRGFVEKANELNSAYTQAKYNQTQDKAWGSTPLITVNGKMLNTQLLTNDPASVDAAIKASA